MIKKLLTTVTSMTMIAGIGSSLAFGTAVAHATPSERYSGRNYAASLAPLNRSGVTGSAQLSFKGRQLNVNLTATGLVPNMPHPAHIHGQLTGADAFCPTIAADTNGDNFISVVEGAPAYGPIKLNLTTPQTAFGPPANLTLFAPFAGIPNIANFPVGTASGNISIDQTYTFDMSKPADRQAYMQLKALDRQHIVVHGGYAPKNVDTPGGGSQEVYDALLPVACGQIRMSYSSNNTARVQFKMNKVNDHASAHDSEGQDDASVTNE